MSEAVVETVDLTKRFGGVTAVDHVNFALKERELRCLIGPNGAGKSTFFKCLTGQYRLDSGNGRVLIRGSDVIGLRPHEIVRMGVGIKTQVPSVMNGLTVTENLWLAARRAHGWTRSSAEVQRVIDEVGLGDLARRTVGELAHGQRQMVEIGIVLAQDPWLVLLDEPAAGITGAEVERLVHLIRQINQNASVIVVDHDMEFVRMLSARITVFHQGAVLTEGAPEKVLSDARVREVYIGNRAR
jgi:branched-chain amino acid transport system ATP-binding protein/urea transport system ATP-binding protein